MYIQQPSAGAAAWWGRGDFFRWEGEPQRKLQKRPLRLGLGRHVCISKILLEPRHLSGVPLLLYEHLYSPATERAYTATERTNRIRSRRSVMSLLFPTLPDSLDLPRGIPSSSTPLAGGMHRGPRLGP